MLRRTFISLKAGDFVLTLPNENVYRSIFTLANPPEEGQTVNETESLARSIVTRAKDLASSTSSNNNNNNKLFTPSHSPALVTSNVLFSSPLFQLSGVPTSTQEPETLFVWSPVTSSSGATVSCWSGVSSASSSPKKKIIAVVPAENGDVQFFEASNNQTSSSYDGRVQVTLNKKIEIPSSSSSADGGASMASSLIQAQLRLDHASWAWSQIRAIIKSCAEIGTQTKFQSGRMAESTVFCERVGSMGSMEHSLFAAIQHTAMTLAESLTVATPLMLNKTEESKAEAIARDIEYDSGLLYLYSRNLLRVAQQGADQLFLRHGPFDDALTKSFRGNETWLAAGQNCDMTPIAQLCDTLGKYALESNKSGASSSSSSSSSKSGGSKNPVTEAVNSLFKSKEPETFSDVHMNLTSSTSSIIADFQSLKNITSSSSAVNSSQRQVVPLIASELMGTTACAYYTSNALEIGEGFGETVKTGDFPGCEMFACDFASPTECSAVAWLALEVASGSSKVRRGELLRELEAMKVADGINSSSKNSTTNPAKLPRAPEQKQQQTDEE